MLRIYLVRTKAGYIKGLFVKEHCAIEYVDNYKSKLMSDFPDDPERVRSEELIITPIDTDLLDYILARVPSNIVYK